MEILSIFNMSIGLNILNITIKDFNFYYPKSFLFNIFVNKVSIFTEILDYKDNIIINEDFYIKVYYFYLNNNTEVPLINNSIIIQFRESNNIIINFHQK